jgi:uncharacterized protein (DUF3084 family)
VSTLSRDESRLEDKYRFEKLIAGLTDDNRLVNEKYQIIQQQILKAEQELVHWKEAAQNKDTEIVQLQGACKQLNEDYLKALKEFKQLQLQNEEAKIKQAKKHPQTVKSEEDRLSNRDISH